MHTPVLQKEILEILKPEPNQNFIDATFGFGGHSQDILKKIGPGGKVLGIEIDPLSIKTFKETNSFSHDSLERLILVNDSYINIDNLIKKNNFQDAKGIIFDLGLSSWHLDESKRGFSFKRDEPLDMRFNPDRNQLTAFEIVNYWKEEELEKIFKDYGQEQFARIIAKKIVQLRAVKPIRTTLELAQLILDNVPGWYKRRKIHPATKIFQSLRIATNNELETVKQGIEKAVNTAPPKTIIAVISFHSLEDKIVKTIFKEQKKGIALFKKPITASIAEINQNPRSRSAKLRAIQII